MSVERVVGREVLATALRAPEHLADFMNSSQVVVDAVFAIERLVAERTDKLKANENNVLVWSAATDQWDKRSAFMSQFGTAVT